MTSTQKGDFMRVLVLGATGRLGTMLRWAWKSDETGFQPLWQGRIDATGAGWVRCDILGDPAGLAAACTRADVILDLVGVTPASGGDMGVNTDLALAVQRAAGGRPHLVASSAAVYGRAAGLCRERDAVVPAAPYGVAKRAMERAVLAKGGPVTCLRIGNVAGADAILGQARRGLSGPPAAAMVLDQFPDGSTPRRSYIGPATLARVLADLCRAAGKGRAVPHILNIAAPGTVEMGELLAAAGHPWTPRPAAGTAIAEVALDISALSRFTRPDPASGAAAALVAEWRAYQEEPAPQ